MSSTGSTFTPLEQVVLRAICETHPADRVALEAQLSTAILRSRENTGCGFFTHFSVDRVSPAIGGTRMRDGPAAKIEGLDHGMGFILWLEEGYADCLEGYNWADESTTGIVLETISFEIVQGAKGVPDAPHDKK
jgi:hypothetical protein